MRYPYCAMDIDENRIDDAVLALLLLGLHDGQRAWKSFDWDSLDRGGVAEVVGIRRWRNLRLVRTAGAGVFTPAEITP